MPDNPILYLGLLGLIVGFSAWAGWTLGARRAARPIPPPDVLWLCDACHSFNEPERRACYACHRARPGDARTVERGADFQLVQRTGRPIDDGGRGATGLWLGADEPLLDDWLAGHRAPAPAAEPADFAEMPLDRSGDDATSTPH
ncbi:MAG: hypothetical protein WEE50_04315 [Chloroflexota bacterium]